MNLNLLVYCNIINCASITPAYPKSFPYIEDKSQRSSVEGRGFKKFNFKL